jgi:hypothetical protein
MRKLTCLAFTFALCILASRTTISADNAKKSNTSERDRVFDFIQKNLIGKKFVHDYVARVASGQVEGEYHGVFSYSHLVKTGTGLTFDLQFDGKRKLYDLDEKGQRLDRPPVVSENAGARRIELRPAKSTGKLTGYSHMISSSQEESIGRAMGVRVTSEKGHLWIRRNSVNYSDLYDKAGKTKPGYWEIDSDFSIVDGNVVETVHETSRSIDIDTLKAGEIIDDFTHVFKEAGADKQATP